MSKKKFNIPKDEPVKAEPELSGNIVLFPKVWGWSDIFLYLKRINRDVDWWGKSTDGRPECHLRKIG